MLIKVTGKEYEVNKNEFEHQPHERYSNLLIRKDIGLIERIVSLINELSCLSVKNLIIYNTNKGGYLPINCSTYYENITLIETNMSHIDNVLSNINNFNVKNITILKYLYNIENIDNSNIFIFSDNVSSIDIDYIQENKPLLLTTYNEFIDKTKIYKLILKLTNSDLCLYVPDKLIDNFKKEFYYFINENNELDYDNLNHLCIMVKNGGPQFEQMLLDNIPFFDRWTILDTGSTDDTINIINRILVGKKKGNLYQEPFINFRDSRNRCLDLAGTSCKFTTMLDDTYVITGNLRNFLNEVRGDQCSNSFTLYIKSDDTIYGSNRIIKTETKLRYVHRIHEVITDKNNINIVIPNEVSFINDRRFDYMEKRTMERKQLDLKLLYEEVDDNPHDPRAYYYLAQTYNLLEDYENSYKYFLKRSSFTNSGFIQERVDSLFEAGRLANFKLNKPWTECLALYEQCYKLDESRPEALYFIGIHYYVVDNDYNKAYIYFKKAFGIGFPIHCQYSLKPTLSYHFLPKFLTKICYILDDYMLGEAAAKLFLDNNKQDADDYLEILSWHNIFSKLNKYKGPKVPKIPIKPLFVFCADGGFNEWSGSNILTTGVGGSETYIIEMARWIQKTGNFQTIVFCNTPNGEEELFEGTIYKPISQYYEFVNTNYIHSCLVSRFSEYLPITFKGWTENVYLVVHDLTPSGIVIPIDKKLKNVFCLTEWHVTYLNSIFPQLANITVPFYYGIDDKFKSYDGIIETNKFIYSSFPNRGLLQLLEMWPTIIENFPTSTLHIYSDVYNKWSNDVEPTKMQQIRDLLVKYKSTNNGLGIYYYGWVCKEELANAWKTADIWFYPCTFMETFCLTALEAASSQTFVVTNDLAALQNTVGDRGLIIKGDPTTKLWQEEALKQLFFYLNNKKEKQHLIDINFKWANGLSWETQTNKFLEQYILKNSTFEYKGMYNWTNDLPFGEKQIFLEVINYFNKTHNNDPIKVLEIGTYAGISLINLIQNIPNSIGVGVDMWCNYNENNLLESIDNLKVKESFFKNIKTAGLQGKIVGIQKDSTDALLNYIQCREKFNFIYIDGSHLLLDCYSDLVLAWEILEQGGILAIDDYLYKKDTILDSPFEAVNHFLKRYNGKYKLLHKSYRVFLEKSAL
jgi:predicted O-methyltransferase YrrM